MNALNMKKYHVFLKGHAASIYRTNDKAELRFFPSDKYEVIINW